MSYIVDRYGFVHFYSSEEELQKILRELREQEG